jgi:hypothetical protein
MSIAVVKSTRWLAWQAREPMIFAKKVTDARIADDDDVGTLPKKLQIHQAQDAVFQLRSTLMMTELEAVDRRAGAETRETKATFDGAAVSGFQFAISERLQCSCETEVFSGGINQDLIQILAHRREAELI